MSAVTSRAARSAALAVTSCLLVFAAPAAGADRISVLPGFGGYNAAVSVITAPDSSGVRYVGGNFTRFNEIATGASMMTDASTGAIDKTFPKVQGNPGQSSKVNATLPDGSGGYYIGGDFTKVDGQTANYAAHIKSDGSLDTSWDPKVDGEVLAITRSGSKIYLGGRFWNVGGESRHSLAAVDATTGAVDTGFAQSTDSSVYAIAVDGSTVYVGGDFGQVGSSTRKGLAAIGTDGSLKSWTADISNYGRVNSIAVGGSSIYAGGTFTTVGGQSRKNAAAIGTDGTVASWNPSPDSEVQAVLISGTTVYLGGWFSKIGATTRMGIAAVGTDGTLKSWNPNITDANNYGVSSMAISGSNLYFGGMFHQVAGTERNDAAAVALSDASLTGWNPDVDHRQGDVNVVSVVGSKVLVGGGFETAGGIPRLHLAAIDANGDLTSWDPGIQEPDPTDSNYPNAYVNDMLVDGSTIYVAGTLTGTVGGVARPKLAAIGTDGQVKTAFNPPAISGNVRAITKMGSNLYMAGVFSLGGQSRNTLAAVDATTGAAQSWAPYVNSGVSALANDGTNIYVGGAFDRAGSAGILPYQAVTRNRLAAFDASGTMTSWNPNVTVYGSGGVYAMSIVGSTVYLGGNFSAVSSQTRSNAAAVTTAGALTAWNPNANDAVNSISVSGGNVYLGGAFTTVGGTSHVYVAAVGTNGTVKSWDPKITSGPNYFQVTTISADSTKVMAAGGFEQIDAAPTAGWLATASPPGDAPPPAPSLSGAPSGLVNTRSATIGFSSAGATSYTCSVDGGAYSACTSPRALTSLADGAHSLAVKAVNGSGTSDATTANWVVDATAPAKPVFTGVPGAPTSSTSASVTATAEAGATLTCKLDGVTRACTNGVAMALTGLAVGAHTVTAVATDPAGNASATATASWTIVTSGGGGGGGSGAGGGTSSPGPVISKKSPIVTKAYPYWLVTLDKTFSITPGSARLQTVQFSTSVTIPPGRPLPTSPSSAPLIFAWANSIKVAGKTPTWVRVSNAAGRWTTWTAIRPG